MPVCGSRAVTVKSEWSGQGRVYQKVLSEQELEMRKGDRHIPGRELSREGTASEGSLLPAEVRPYTRS